MPFNTRNLTVVRIQQSDYVCPPNWHQMANMCFSLPHLIHKNNGQVDLPYCFCDFVGSHIHLINGVNIKNIAASAEEKDPVFTKYFNVLRETYSGDLYVRGRERDTDRNFDLARSKGLFMRTSRGNKHNTRDHDTPELCSMDISKQEISCSHGFFVCKDHTCLVETSRCDGHEDCVSGYDEMSCSDICSDPDPTEKCTL